MSKVNVKIAGASYDDVPAIILRTPTGEPKKFYEISDTTAMATDVLNGKKFYTADGTLTEGAGQQSINGTTGDITIESSEPWGIEVTQHGNQTITATPKVGYTTTADGKYKTTLNAVVSIEPYTGFVPGAIKKTADEVNHIINVTAGDAGEIEGMVQNGYGKVYRKSISFYSDVEYKARTSLIGKILVVGGTSQKTGEVTPYDGGTGIGYNDKLTAYIDTFIQEDTTAQDDAYSGFLCSCEKLEYVDLPNLFRAGSKLLCSCAALKSANLQNLISVGFGLLSYCTSLETVDLSCLETSTNTNQYQWNDMFYQCDSLRYIIRNNTKVPKVGSDGWYTLDCIPSTCKLLVPESAVDAYKADANFGKNFGDRIEALEDYNIVRENGAITVTKKAV